VHLAISIFSRSSSPRRLRRALTIDPISRRTKDTFQHGRIISVLKLFMLKIKRRWKISNYLPNCEF